MSPVTLSGRVYLPNTWVSCRKVGGPWAGPTHNPGVSTWDSEFLDNLEIPFRPLSILLPRHGNIPFTIPSMAPNPPCFLPLSTGMFTTDTSVPLTPKCAPLPSHLGNLHICVTEVAGPLAPLIRISFSSLPGPNAIQHLAFMPTHHIELPFPLQSSACH